MRKGVYALLLFILCCLVACDRPESHTFDLSQVTDNEQVANYMKTFEGRGAISDGSTPTEPLKALSKFRLPPNLEIDLVLAEPDVHQPLEVVFDYQGRLWVIQYNQYPYPKGLKVTGIDNHLRITFDKVPEPPPIGVTGADKITFFEDTNGDGNFDKSTDAITGLNIATGIAFGRGSIWVLNPPYLLAYPDEQHDGLPDGPPKVHLEGFGLQDTHAVANSLRWGPDGWLYGATGSTVTSQVSSAATNTISWQGQGIWRYHPETNLFELFAEGGGNTFHIEIDSKGRIYSGDNGANTRGQYYKQGGYYVKNWGKHGALTNPYAFGYLKNMSLEGDAKRFTHAWIKYEGHTLPGDYQGQMFAINPLLNYLQLSQFIPTGSTFKTLDLKRVLTTEDHWFRPVDIKAGPDGAIYLADWYDSRLSHVDPNDTWHKSSGRIYRIRGNAPPRYPTVDFNTYSSEDLIKLLSHPNKWHRQQALCQFGDRKDPLVAEALSTLLIEETDQLALEALWALHLGGSFNIAIANAGLNHQNPFVRLWTVRLLCDARVIPQVLLKPVIELAAKENHPEVLSQFACSAKRLSADQAIPVINSLLLNTNHQSDLDNPLLIWWALEAQLTENTPVVVRLFEHPDLWSQPVIVETILERLAQRMVMSGSKDELEGLVRLIHLSPDQHRIKPMLTGILEGLSGRDLSVLPSKLITAIEPYMKNQGQAPLAFAIRKGDSGAIKEALSIIADEATNINERLVYLDLMGALRVSESIPTLLDLVETPIRTSITKSSLSSLTNFDQPHIGERVAAAYPDKLRADPVLKLAALNLLSSRVSWALELLNMIETEKQVNKADVPPQIVGQLMLLNDLRVNQSVNHLWPEATEVSSLDKKVEMERVATVIKSGKGDYGPGKILYQPLCGSCHKLFGEGGQLAPDLTGYDRSNLNYLILNIIDPNLEIREGFVNYKIISKNGRTLTGTIVNRSSRLVVVKGIDGGEITIPTDQIKLMEAQSKSLMPERLLDGLSDQDLRDLFAYLMKETSELGL